MHFDQGGTVSKIDDFNPKEGKLKFNLDIEDRLKHPSNHDKDINDMLKHPSNHDVDLSAGADIIKIDDDPKMKDIEFKSDIEGRFEITDKDAHQPIFKEGPNGMTIIEQPNFNPEGKL